MYDFLLLRFPLIDVGVGASEKYFGSSIGLFLFFESFRS